jgi:hypothetical protein
MQAGIFTAFLEARRFGTGMLLIVIVSSLAARMVY